MGEQLVIPEGLTTLIISGKDTHWTFGLIFTSLQTLASSTEPARRPLPFSFTHTPPPEKWYLPEFCPPPGVWRRKSLADSFHRAEAGAEAAAGTLGWAGVWGRQSGAKQSRMSGKEPLLGALKGERGKERLVTGRAKKGWLEKRSVGESRVAVLRNVWGLNGAGLW